MCPDSDLTIDSCCPERDPTNSSWRFDWQLLIIHDFHINLLFQVRKRHDKYWMWVKLWFDQVHGDCTLRPGKSFIYLVVQFPVFMTTNQTFSLGIMWLQFLSNIKFIVFDRGDKIDLFQNPNTLLSNDGRYFFCGCFGRLNLHLVRWFNPMFPVTVSTYFSFGCDYHSFAKKSLLHIHNICNCTKKESKNSIWLRYQDIVYASTLFINSLLGVVRLEMEKLCSTKTSVS